MAEETWPRVVTEEQWQAELDSLADAEGSVNNALRELAAQRRRLPVTEVGTPYEFDGPRGKASLSDLFSGRRQLIVYHFYAPAGSTDICMGCSAFVDNLGRQEHLHARNTCFIGGLAVQRWGEPRQTRDVDLTLLTGFGTERPFVDELLDAFDARLSDAATFAMHRCVAGRGPRLLGVLAHQVPRGRQRRGGGVPARRRPRRPRAASRAPGAVVAGDPAGRAA